MTDPANSDDDHVLYRHFNEAGELLYIGISSRFMRRTREHEKYSAWFKEITLITVERFVDRRALLQGERIAIEIEKPKYNVVHNIRSGDKFGKSSPLQASINELTARLVSIPLTATPERVADIVGLSRSFVRKAIEDGKLGYFEIPNRAHTKMVKIVSGWHMLDWLDDLGAGS